MLALCYLECVVLFSPAHLLWEKFQLFWGRECKHSFSPSHETPRAEFRVVPWQHIIFRNNGNSVSESASRGSGRAQHSARESELIAGLRAGPGPKNPSLSAPLAILHVLQEARRGYVTAATPGRAALPVNQGPFLPELPAVPGLRLRIRLCHWLFVYLRLIPHRFSKSFSKFKGLRSGDSVKASKR